MNIAKYKHIFLDRDGVINEVIIRGNVISSPRSMKEFKIRQDFLNFISSLKTHHDFYVVTNQPDISRGLLLEDDLVKMHLLIESILNVKKIMYCPHSHDNDCSCRKPKPGMLEALVNEFRLDKKECILIGDSKKDIDAAINFGIDHVYLKTRYNISLKNTHAIHSLIDLVI